MDANLDWIRRNQLRQPRWQPLKAKARSTGNALSESLNTSQLRGQIPQLQTASLTE
jgi:hypothetical protein